MTLVHHITVAGVLAGLSLSLTLQGDTFVGLQGSGAISTHGERVEALRLKAKAHIAAERALFSAPELADIEERYRSAHVQQLPLVRRPEGPGILEQLVETYPRSNRAGCAVLELAALSSGSTREGFLRIAIDRYSGAWFESGVQVGALARAMLAVHLAGLGRFDEAERVATELASSFPGSIDHSGALLDDLPQTIRLLR
jgi:hypothetical protein